MFRIASILLLALLWAGCGSGDESTDPSGGSASSGSTELTDFEMEHGIGPVTDRLDIGGIDLERAQRGADFFDSRCASCHRMENRFVGPPLGSSAEKRSNEFLVNFILNPEEMTNRHPVGQALLQEYLTIMPYQNVSMDQAIEIVDFLRHYSETGVDLRD
jgi:hypothetical protein